MSIIAKDIFCFDDLGRKVKVGTYDKIIPPTSLTITGDWTNTQYTGSAVDYTGLVFTVTDNNETNNVIIPTSISPSVWGDTAGTQTVTFTYTEGEYTVTATKDATVQAVIPTSLSINSNLINGQNYGEAPNTTGLIFTANYNNGTSAVVTPTVSPSTWNDIGTQTATFSYTLNGTTVSTTKSVNVNNVLSSLSVSGNWTNDQTEGSAPDTTGLSWTATFANGDTSSVIPTVSPNVWSTNKGNQTATFSYTYRGTTVTTTKDANMTYTYSIVSGGHGSVSGSGTYTYNADNSQTKSIGYNPDSEYYFAGWTTNNPNCSATDSTLTIDAGCQGNISATASFDLIVPVSLVITGDWGNTQYEDFAVDYTGLTFTATYNNGDTSTIIPTSLIPNKWRDSTGSQTCTFNYTRNGVTVSASKSANIASWNSVPLTLKAREDGNIFLVKYQEGSSAPGTVYYSKNGVYQGELEYGINVSVLEGDTVSFFRTLSADLDENTSFSINSDIPCYVYGNIMSLYDEDDFETADTIEYNYAFLSLFFDRVSHNTNPNIDINESIGKFVLPATTLSDYCYLTMFYKCTGLTSIPSDLLRATTLARECYSGMFSGCTGLTSIPSDLLPNIILAPGCYSNMFSNCTGLTTLPEGLLPSIMLSDNCYQYMFYGCTGLTTVPSNLLPTDTILFNSCYYGMFQGCTSLTTAPELPAATLATSCYQNMFNGCTSLSEITCLATDISASNCTTDWVYGVAATGTFIKNVSMSSWTTGDSGIPTGWTIESRKYPSSLSITGDWDNTQYIGNAVDYTGLVFTVTYTDGSTKTVTPTSLSPSTWSLTIGTQSCTFSYTEGGISVSDSKSASVVLDTRKKVGGTIFYIDNTADGTYRFFNAQGQEVSAPTVGTDCTDWSYAVSGATKDKFYVYNSSAMFKRDRSGTQTDPYVAWSYLDESNQSYIDNKEYTSGLPSGRTEWSYYGFHGRVYETLDGTYTGTAIGTGKSNTSNMLSLRSGVYNQGSQMVYKGESIYSETIWYICYQFNKGTYSLNGSSVLNNTGCNDWYIPSAYELEAMKNAIGYSTFASMLYSGDLSTAYVGTWSSSAASSVYYSWAWGCNKGSDGGMYYNDYRYDYPPPYGGKYYCLALSRSF